MREPLKVLGELAKKEHDVRVAKTPERIEYAIQQFEQNNIEFQLKSKANGHFHIFDRDDNLIQFWASTGKIISSKIRVRGIRGIHNLIKFITKKGE